MTQLFAIIRYELLMSWRRRLLPMLTVAFLLGLLFTGAATDQSPSALDSSVIAVRVEGGVTIVTRQTLEGGVSDEALDAETARSLPDWLIGINLDQAGNTLRGIVVIISASIIIIVAIIPFLSDIIPMDRQIKVRPLLDAAPLHRTVYLAGKVLSVWVGLSLSVLVCLIITQTLLYARYGAYDLGALLLLWALFVLPLVLLVSGGIVLATSWAGSRRAALLTAIALIPVGCIAYVFGLPALAQAGRLVHPFYGIGITDIYVGTPDYRVVLLNDITGMLIAFALSLAVLGGGAWWIARRQEAR